MYTIYKMVISRDIIFNRIKSIQAFSIYRFASEILEILKSMTINTHKFYIQL